MFEAGSKEKELYNKFADALCNNTDEMPQFVSKDASYYMKLQHDKMQRLGLSMQEHLTPAGALKDDAFARRFDGAHHYGFRLFSGFIRKTDYFKNGKRIFRRKEKMTLFQMILQAKDSIDPQSTECCPSCGAVVTLDELEHGCPYCRSSFLMGDLYPKITDYFWLHDYSFSPFETRKRLWTWGGLFGIVAAISGALLIPTDGSSFPLLQKAYRIIMCGGSGFMLGAIASGIPLFIKVFTDAAKAAPILNKIAGDKKRLEKFMKAYDPHFFYELFESRVLALMKIMIYGGGTSESAVYCGKTPFSSDIVDAAYIGAIDIERMELQGAFIWITLTVYADCMHYRDRKLTTNRDKHRMRIFKNASAVTDPGFSIHKVECLSCGASFDAGITKKCPYCGRDYRLYDHDWTIDMIEFL